MRPYLISDGAVHGLRLAPFVRNTDILLTMEIAVKGLAENILAYAAGLPEGVPLAAKDLLHLGNRAAVDQALSRLARHGRLQRAGRGIYLRPVQSRFGKRTPSPSKVIEAIAAQRGETVVAHGAAAANALGLTTQVPVREVYLTSGPSRQLKLGAQVIELRHAPNWQLLLPGRQAGSAVRALAWLGPEQAGEALRKLKRKLPASDLREMAAARGRLPTWMAQEISTLVA